MANKTLGTRQKLTFRIKLSNPSLKPRNPVAIVAKQRAAGPHQKTASAMRHRQQRLLKKNLAESDSD
jgi:hypothetical protein